MKRLRLVSLRIQPVIMVDDGEILTQFANAPSDIPAAELDSLPERLRADIAETERQINTDDVADDTA